MNKYNLMKKIASIATQLDVKGLTREAKTMDNVLIEVAAAKNLKFSQYDNKYHNPYHNPTDELWYHLSTRRHTDLDWLVEGLDEDILKEWLRQLNDKTIDNLLDKNEIDYGYIIDKIYAAQKRPEKFRKWREYRRNNE